MNSFKADCMFLQKCLETFFCTLLAMETSSINNGNFPGMEKYVGTEIIVVGLGDPFTGDLVHREFFLFR